MGNIVKMWDELEDVELLEEGKGRSDREENENEHAKLSYISVLSVL